MLCSLNPRHQGRNSSGRRRCQRRKTRPGLCELMGFERGVGQRQCAFRMSFGEPRQQARPDEAVTRGSARNQIRVGVGDIRVWTFAPAGFENAHRLALLTGLSQEAARERRGRDQPGAQLGGILGQFARSRRVVILERQGLCGEQDGALSPKSIKAYQPALAIALQGFQRARPIAIAAAEFERSLSGPGERRRSLRGVLGILAGGNPCRPNSLVSLRSAMARKAASAPARCPDSCAVCACNINSKGWSGTSRPALAANRRAAPTSPAPIAMRPRTIACCPVAARRSAIVEAIRRGARNSKRSTDHSNIVAQAIAATRIPIGGPA